MILHPSILALLVGSVAVSFITLYTVPVAAQILRRWDIRSGNEAQIVLERKTYLVSTLLAYVFAFEFFSLFLPIGMSWPPSISRPSRFGPRKA